MRKLAIFFPQVQQLVAEHLRAVGITYDHKRAAINAVRKKYGKGWEWLRKLAGLGIHKDTVQRHVENGRTQSPNSDVIDSLYACIVDFVAEKEGSAELRVPVEMDNRSTSVMVPGWDSGKARRGWAIEGEAMVPLLSPEDIIVYEARDEYAPHSVVKVSKGKSGRVGFLDGDKLRFAYSAYNPLGLKADGWTIDGVCVLVLKAKHDGTSAEFNFPDGLTLANCGILAPPEPVSVHWP